MEEKNWVISLSNGFTIKTTEQKKKEIVRRIYEHYGWLEVEGVMFNANNVIAIYEQKKPNGDWS